MVGETIGSYQIISQLGAGAMGEVYLAEHRHLKRKAALKLLARELIDRPELLERFFLEARATSAIEHPGIVRIFDCEVDASGRPYIVMEYLAGDTLAVVLGKRGPLPAMTAARLARGMAEALQAAHEKGIVHRDLKPENVFVEAQPPEAVKLVDFGIAKLAGELHASQVHQTRSGAMMGTPLYMSPEQCRDSASIDFRTDIYSLGCVMFEMATGRPPFVYDALGDLIVAHMTEQPKEARAVNAAVPPALSSVIGDLLRKDPAARPADMRAIAERLGTFIAGVTTVKDVPAPVPPTVVGPTKTTFGSAAGEVVDGARARAAPRRRMGPLLIVAAVIAFGVGGLTAHRMRARADADVTAPAAAPPAPVAAAPASVAAAHAPTTAAMPTPAAPSPADQPPGRTADVTGVASPSKPASGHAKRSAGHRAAPETIAAAATPPAAERAATAPALSGVWEGPWTDPPRRQHGRLYLQIAGDGAATGWMFNQGANRSFRLIGKLASDGQLELACQCPPRQAFAVRGALHADGQDALRGQIALSAGAEVFGESRVVLRKGAAAGGGR